MDEPLPENIGLMSFMADTADPLAELPSGMPEAILQPVARLLLVERLIGGRHASRITDFAIGPPHFGRRAISLGYVEARRYSNVAPEQRAIQGQRTGR